MYEQGRVKLLFCRVNNDASLNEEGAPCQKLCHYEESSYHNDGSLDCEMCWLVSLQLVCVIIARWL